MPSRRRLQTVRFFNAFEFCPELLTLLPLLYVPRYRPSRGYRRCLRAYSRTNRSHSSSPLQRASPPERLLRPSTTRTSRSWSRTHPARSGGLGRRHAVGRERTDDERAAERPRWSWVGRGQDLVRSPLPSFAGWHSVSGARFADSRSFLLYSICTTNHIGPFTPFHQA